MRAAGSKSYNLLLYFHTVSPQISGLHLSYITKSVETKNGLNSSMQGLCYTMKGFDDNGVREWF